MIKIFNKKLNSEILIDEKTDWVQFSPRDYEDKPHIIIEFKEFNLVKHAYNCPDCRCFINSFGKNNLDWYISYSNKLYRLNTEEIGGKTYPSNEIILTNSKYNTGTN